MNLSDSDFRTLSLMGAVLVLLFAAWGIIKILKRRPESGIDAAILETFRLRVRAWWILFAVLAAAFLLGQRATVVLFGLISFWALREFITLTPTRPGDHRTLFWVFFVCTPLQFVLVGMGYKYYGLYSIVIPVYAFLFVPARIAMAGDSKRFLERTAKIQAGLLICVYCLSYAPALMTLRLPPAADNVPAASPEDQEARLQAPLHAADNAAAQSADEKAEKDKPAEGGTVRLLLFFVLIVQLSDALQYAWSQIPSKHVIVPTINPTRTWEGLLGGTASVTLIGAVLWWATPFYGANWWMAALMSAVISLMGFAGSITMSAIKRDRGVKDYGTLVEGHGGVLDRIDSMCFAAPVFFHCTRWWLVLNGFIPPAG
jgi:phosphatidate cytidylyltransferase